MQAEATIRTTRRAMLAMGAGALAARAAALMNVAAFRCDATPAMGEPNIWVQPVTSVMDPLWVKGVVLERGRDRFVLAAIDWCGVGGETDLQLRTALARGAGTDVTRVALQAVHQHAAPYIDGDGYQVLAAKRPGAPRMSAAFLRKLASEMESAARAAAGKLEPFDEVGTGQAKVERVASARRLLKGGKIVTRYSSTATSPELAAEPEGDIDPWIRVVTLARGGLPLVRLSYYATHPQTFCCDGRVSADFAGAARERMEKEDGVPQVYFTGCGGDVTVGKYNRGEDAEREALAERLLAGMKAAAAATRLEKATGLEWRYRALSLPVPAAAPSAAKAESDQLAYRAAIAEAFAKRTRPLPASALFVGRAAILHLPGEPLLEFQKYALEVGKDRFVAVAGYGDISPGYLCPDVAFEQGGYEPSASNAAPGTEARVKEVIRELLGR